MKRKTQQIIDSFEAAKELPGSVKRSITEDLLKESVSDIWEQMLGPKEEAKKRSGELRPGQELDLKQEKKAAIEPGIEYAREIIHAEKKTEVRVEHETKTRIQEILVEIKQLTNSSKELAVQFKDVAKVENIPAKAGKYDINFIEWVLAMIRSAQKRVESAVSWTNAIKGRKNQKQYWSLFKKHGTTFGLSGERVVATQVG